LKLEKELKTTDEALRKHHDTIQEIQKEFADCDAQYQAIKKSREEIELKLNRLEKEILLAEAQIKSTTEKLNILETKIDLTEETSSAEIEQLLEEKQKSEMEKAERESKMEALKADLNKIKQSHQGVTSQWHGITIDIERRKNTLKSIEEDKERRWANIKKLSGEIQSGKVKIEQILRNIDECKVKIDSLEKNYDELKKEQEKHQTRFEELKTMLGNLHMEKHTLQEAIDEKVKEIEKTRAKRENTDKDIAIFTEKQMTVLEKLKTTYNIENPDEIAIEITPHIEDEREAIASEIAAMGEINFRAEKEYLELQERIVFLEKQKEDLHNSVESLKKTIAKIDLLTRELFTETFDKVNEAFKRFTDLLFRGGKGYLAINQENGGVDMFAQPPGKKVVRMELLSGGEKALISLALLLALMDTKPSPFSLMDEIDAPLDDANLMALLEIVKTMGLKTQIIFITHNRNTMESSDTIYGITMEEQGISKTVSVKL
jgi:chromosome segregation protein